MSSYYSFLVALFHVKHLLKIRELYTSLHHQQHIVFLIFS